MAELEKRKNGESDGTEGNGICNLELVVKIRRILLHFSENEFKICLYVPIYSFFLLNTTKSGEITLLNKYGF